MKLHVFPGERIGNNQRLGIRTFAAILMIGMGSCVLANVFKGFARFDGSIWSWVEIVNNFLIKLTENC